MSNESPAGRASAEEIADDIVDDLEAFNYLHKLGDVRLLTDAAAIALSNLHVHIETAASLLRAQAERIKALEGALDDRHTLLCEAQEVVCSLQCRSYFPGGHIKSDADHSALCHRIVAEVDGSAARATLGGSGG